MSDEAFADRIATLEVAIEAIKQELRFFSDLATEADMYGGESGRSRAMALRDLITEVWKCVNTVSVSKPTQE